MFIILVIVLVILATCGNKIATRNKKIAENEKGTLYGKLSETDGHLVESIWV